MTLNEKLAELLGLGSKAEWPFSEDALVELIHLQREKEVTKQQYFKLEILSKSTELLNKCLNVNIPPYLIPMMFAGEAPSEELVQRAQQHSPHPSMQQMQSPQRPPYMQYQQGHLPGPPQHQPAHMQQQQQQQQQPYPHLAPPAKFQRPHSPSRIGAAAVAQLERGRLPPSPMHKHTLSTPVSFGPQLGRPPPPTPPPPPQVQQVSSPTSFKPQHTMMRTMSSIQFINENPGKKRRRSDVKESVEDEGDVTEDEVTDESKNAAMGQRKIRHLRTRSDNFLLDNENRHPEGSTVKDRVKQIDEQQAEKATGGSSAPSIGPKFANNILRSAS